MHDIKSRAILELYKSKTVDKDQVKTLIKSLNSEELLNLFLEDNDARYVPIQIIALTELVGRDDFTFEILVEMTTNQTHDLIGYHDDGLNISPTTIHSNVTDSIIKIIESHSSEFSSAQLITLSVNAPMRIQQVVLEILSQRKNCSIKNLLTIFDGTIDLAVEKEIVLQASKRKASVSTFYKMFLKPSAHVGTQRSILEELSDKDLKKLKAKKLLKMIATTKDPENVRRLQRIHYEKTRGEKDWGLSTQTQVLKALKQELEGQDTNSLVRRFFMVSKPDEVPEASKIQTEISRRFYEGELKEEKLDAISLFFMAVSFPSSSTLGISSELSDQTDPTGVRRTKKLPFSLEKKLGGMSTEDVILINQSLILGSQINLKIAVQGELKKRTSEIMRIAGFEPS